MAFKDTVKNWFKTGLKPTQQQFYSFFDAIRWKDENIPANLVEGLNNLLIAKADKQAFNSHLQDLERYVTIRDKNDLEALNTTIFKHELSVLLNFSDDLEDVMLSEFTFNEFTFVITVSGKKYLIKRTNSKYSLANCMLFLRATNIEANVIYSLEVSNYQLKINEDFSYYELISEDLTASIDLNNVDTFLFYYKRKVLLNYIKTESIQLLEATAKKIIVPLNVSFYGIEIIEIALLSTIEVSMDSYFSEEGYLGELTGGNNDSVILMNQEVKEVWLKSTKDVRIKIIFKNI
ncbi:hypothetical protein PG913_08200 [Tenacibaculum pacificus]|uniref:hypothetical protein n=1 Tax=Tenacibaculum pacificus TaxID=3018314 RepID=UPI0022F3EF56|nr:hypothetical protein [Tenacibaculum pacificus]WBX72884.1 hypothetical protein PG913_08200 [Tenacibaculum pacificus]